PPERCASACTELSTSYDGGTPMTTHDDSNFEQLERDLGQLAMPRETDDAFRLSLRSERLQPPAETPRCTGSSGTSTGATIGRSTSMTPLATASCASAWPPSNTCRSPPQIGICSASSRNIPTPASTPTR